jgi:hypothetical protein
MNDFIILEFHSFEISVKSIVTDQNKKIKLFLKYYFLLSEISFLIRERF